MSITTLNRPWSFYNPYLLLFFSSSLSFFTPCSSYRQKVNFAMSQDCSCLPPLKSDRVPFCVHRYCFNTLSCFLDTAVTSEASVSHIIEVVLETVLIYRSGNSITIYCAVGEDPNKCKTLEVGSYQILRNSSVVHVNCEISRRLEQC
jgi:hypothetical protein